MAGAPSISPDCVVKVGNGRGFVMKYRVSLAPLRKSLRPKGLRLRRFREHRVVITAAHCLPNLPPPHGASYTHERTFANLLGRINDSEGSVWAECLFADPVADIAVLGSPDGQELSDEADAWSTLIEENAPALRIGQARSGPGWVLSLDGHWTRTTLEISQGLEVACLTIDATEAGMSGSPILNAAGRAVGVVTLGTIIGGKNERSSGQPILSQDLPGRLLRSWKV